MIAILDYGMGNLRSVEKAFAHVGVDAVRTRDHDVVRGAAGVALPGVGAMPRAMELVRALGFDELVRERAAAGRAGDRHLHGHAAAVRAAPPSTAAPRASACWRAASRRWTRPG